MQAGFSSSWGLRANYPPYFILKSQPSSLRPQKFALEQAALWTASTPTGDEPGNQETAQLCTGSGLTWRGMGSYSQQGYKSLKMGYQYKYPTILTLLITTPKP